MSARTDGAFFQEFKQMPVAFVDAADHVILSRLRLGEQEQTAMPPAAGALHLAEVAVRAGAAASELGQQLGFEVWRDSMLQALRLIVHLVPLHAENLGQHALDEMVTK